MTPEPEWVDLGLPSGLLWAKANLGATLPESPGIYFSWGNTEGHPAGDGYNFSQDEYNTTPAAAITENLSLEQDAARVNLGAPWRMPTHTEFEELCYNCPHIWTSLNGMNGFLFTSNVNGNTLFLPAAGYYGGTSLIGRGSLGHMWSSTYESARNAGDLYFSSDGTFPTDNVDRRYGFTIRAVRPT